MGPAGEASSRADAHNAFFPLPLRAFPSPAPSSNASLDSPTLQRTLTAAATSPGPWTPYSPASDSTAILPSEPAAAKAATVMTPPAEQQASRVRSHATDMNIIVGGALAPVHESAPPRLVAKQGPGLRLPSFEALGIASPCPHDLCLPGANATEAGANGFGKPLPSSTTVPSSNKRLQHQLQSLKLWLQGNCVLD